MGGVCGAFGSWLVRDKRISYKADKESRAVRTGDNGNNGNNSGMATRTYSVVQLSIWGEGEGRGR